MALWREQVTFKSETLGIVDYVMKNNGLRHVPIKRWDTSGPLP